MISLLGRRMGSSQASIAMWAALDVEFIMIS